MLPRLRPSAKVLAWGGYCAASVFFGVLLVALLRQHDQANEMIARAGAEQELHLLNLAVQSDLHRAEDQAAAELMNSWGASSHQIVELYLVGKDGQILAEYHREEAAPETVRLSTGFDYSKNARAIIKLVYDMGPARAAALRFDIGMVALYMLLALGAAVLVLLALERHHALQKLRDTSEVLDNYFNNALDLFCIRTDNAPDKFNARWEEVLGYSSKEIQAFDFLALVHPDDLPASRKAVARLKNREDVTDLTNRLRHKDGSYRFVEWHIRPGGKNLYVAARDVTERKQQEEEIRFLTRIYSTLSETNQAIVRCSNENKLLDDICRIAVDFGGMKLAWIGKLDAATERIVPVARYGERALLLDEIAISARAELPEGDGPAGTAWRSGRPVFVNDWNAEATLAYWRERFPAWSWGSSAALPIHRAGKAYALLNFYDNVPHSFSGKIIGLLSEMVMDIESALARLDLEAQQRLAEQESRIAAIAFETPEPMIVMDAEGGILRANSAFSRTTGYSQDEVIGKNPNFLQSGRHPPEFFAELWQQVRGMGYWQGEIWDRRKNGEVYPKWLTISSVLDGAGNVSNFVASFSDISERKEAAEAISRLAYYDSLTSLPNRQLMMQRLQRALRYSSRSGKFGAVLFLDLDNFKTINDTLGHDEGDRLLLDAAQRLGACLREEDTVARFGGDEFVVLLEDLQGPREHAAILAKGVSDKLLAALAAPFAVQGREFACSASVGVALWSGDTQVDAKELLKRADMAMYEAKKAGRNAARFFDPIMQTAIETRSRLEGRLRMALNLGQFTLHFQRQVRGDGSVFGAEALLRWNDPEHGMVPPAEFIRLAEEFDLIIPIGRWVLRTACRQIKAWSHSEATRGLCLSVNISPKQFASESFVSDVAEILRESGADPSLLQLEITEGMLLTNIEETIAVMAELRRMGVTFALDDFGTGYSSLSYLQRLPLNVLKIDQSFVQELGQNPRSEAIVRTVIQMGQSLGLDILAEGVETEGQREALSRWHCTNYQGYLFGKPGPIETFVLEQHKPSERRTERPAAVLDR